jgi:hypothetical protein
MLNTSLAHLQVVTLAIAHGLFYEFHFTQKKTPGACTESARAYLQVSWFNAKVTCVLNHLATLPLMSSRLGVTTDSPGWSGGSGHGFQAEGSTGAEVRLGLGTGMWRIEKGKNSIME